MKAEKTRRITSAAQDRLPLRMASGVGDSTKSKFAKVISPSRLASRKIPSGPDKPYEASQDLLLWMSDQFKKFGDVYKASILGSDVCVIRDPEYAQHVLVHNWRNYSKGQVIKRVAFLLGNGLMVSEGELWRHQRRMIQPAFQKSSLGAWMRLITLANFALLEKWREAAETKKTVDVTQDVSRMVLDVLLKFIFGDGDDYRQVAPHFAVLSQDPTRNMLFARHFRAVGKQIAEVIVRRRARHPSAMISSACCWRRATAKLANRCRGDSSSMKS